MQMVYQFNGVVVLLARKARTDTMVSDIGRRFKGQAIPTREDDHPHKVQPYFPSPRPAPQHS
jgi:hypothetical protein